MQYDGFIQVHNTNYNANLNFYKKNKEVFNQTNQDTFYLRFVYLIGYIAIKTML
ncbi:hypothetical protein PI23P_09225 [Polaribacter irgensii 23-P]|uniref:Uncharacterized protein n=1 Tax=Polaribacter irgensii 23-P TaxID=313594 RepID=A4C054_9FLAO|nr:hypothetical protein PI23P_09225 [Polaribacter irgensii 23-P]